MKEKEHNLLLFACEQLFFKLHTRLSIKVDKKFRPSIKN